MVARKHAFSEVIATDGARAWDGELALGGGPLFGVLRIFVFRL